MATRPKRLVVGKLNVSIDTYELAWQKFLAGIPDVERLSLSGWEQVMKDQSTNATILLFPFRNQLPLESILGVTLK